MGLFSTSASISESGLLNGFTDWHCHALPGVDDGLKTVEDTFSVLGSYEQAGVREVWFTPHIMEDIPNRTATLKQIFTDLKLRYRGTVNLHLASEYMLDSLFEERLEEDDLLPLEGRRLLVETSYFNPPLNFRETLEKIRRKGWYPVLAHPERYVYMSRKDYRDIKDSGVLFQLNIPSLYGSYGPEPEERALDLLKDGMYDLSGTDLHRAGSLQHLLDAKLKTKTIKQIPR